jgi:hypothetical protein
MSTQVVEVNMAEVRAADYMNAAFLQSPGVTQAGDGQCALAMAYHAINGGVSDAEVRDVRDAIADENAQAFLAAAGMGEAPEQVRESVRIAGRQFAERSPQFAELFEVAAPLLTTWRAYGAFVLHLDRIQKQVALITGLRKQA